MRVQLAEVKERNLVLEKREQMRSRELDSGELAEAVPVPFSERNSAPKVSAVTEAVVAPVPAREPVVQSVGSAETGEHFLYAKVLETYQKRNVAELQKSTQLLLRTYPDSVFADNALYLSGMLALELGDMARASSFMDRVLKEYPLGNKAVSALFAKGVIEKRSKKPNEAHKLFLKVRSLYPGSPEAARVGLEFELLKVRES
jgi:TolA-binding protein